MESFSSAGVEFNGAGVHGAGSAFSGHVTSAGGRFEKPLTD